MTKSPRSTPRPNAKKSEERNLQRLATTVARATARGSLARQQHGLEELGVRLVKNAAGLANNHATAAVMTLLDEVERGLLILTARLEAAAPEVVVRVGSRPEQVMCRSGRLRFLGNIVQAAIDPLTIRVGDLATITVSPPAASNAADQRKRQESQKRLSKLIEEAGATECRRTPRRSCAAPGIEAEAFRPSGRN